MCKRLQAGAGRVERRGEEITGGQAAVGPPFFNARDDRLLTWQMVELVDRVAGSSS